MAAPPRVGVRAVARSCELHGGCAFAQRQQQEAAVDYSTVFSGHARLHLQPAGAARRSPLSWDAHGCGGGGGAGDLFFFHNTVPLKHSGRNRERKREREQEGVREGETRGGRGGE